MDANTKDSLSKLCRQYDINEDEQAIIQYANTHTIAKNNHAEIIATFLLIKQIKKSTDLVTESNSLLIKADDRNSKKMEYLTWALIIVGAIQAISAIISIFLH